MTAPGTSSTHLSFPRLILRILFIVGLLLLLSAPQLRSPAPEPPFRWLRDLLEALSTWQWLLILVGIAGLTWLVTLPGRQGRVDFSTQAPAARLPISEAVSPANGGNGLVTAPYQPVLPWLGLAGWVEIKDAGKECVVIDGRRVYRNTALLVAPSRLLGRPVSARRVLLQPAPLTDVSAASTTADKLNLTMVVSAKYEVLDPIYTASLQAPLKELADLLAGAVRNYVPSDTLENILLNEGELNERMRQRVSESPSIAGKYRIVEILKAMPTGDQRIIEIINQTREAIQRRALIAQEGDNRKLQAETDLEIQRRLKEQEDEFKARDHQRDVEVLRLQDSGETQRQLLQMIGAIAAAGMDPGSAVDAVTRIRAVYSGAVQLPPPAHRGEQVSLIDAERQELAEISNDLGLRSYTVEANPKRAERPQSAWLGFDGYSLMIECPEDYPNVPPVVKMQVGTTAPRRIGIAWVPGNRIADAAISAAAQNPLSV